MICRTLLLSALTLVAIPMVASAEVTLPSIFSDNAVLQAGTKVPVWGKAAAGEEVSVTIGAQSQKTKADEQGKWRVDLNNLSAGGPVEMTVAGANTITIKNILVGEVWLASGQSNMEYGLPHALNAEKEIAAANYPEIRVFTTKNVVADQPLENAEGKWLICTPENAKGFSATGYFFARDLHLAIKKPVGLIHSSVGGTLAEAWTSVEALGGDPDFAPILQRYADAVKNYPAARDADAAKLAEWEKAAAAAKAENKPAPPKPAAALDPSQQTTKPGGLFNGKIAPLIPYAIKGVIWYQGEYNAPRGEQYRKLFPALITDWRKRWTSASSVEPNIGDFPFLYVQLANFIIPPEDEARYEELREAQLMTLKLPNTGMAVACDVGDPHDIHPPNKQAIGGRLALIARGMVYGEKDLVYSGPIYKSMAVKGDSIHISFDHVEGGLNAKGDASSKLAGFEIAGEEKQFVEADARIDGNEVVVSSANVKNPLAVRYAWKDNPTMSLYNGADLPASPFRTDDWPVRTTGKR